MMKSARLATSNRLQRVHQLLSDGGEHSTMDIIRGAEVAAVNSIIAELRDNGCYIECRCTRSPTSGERIWLYRMPSPTRLSPPPSRSTE